MRHDKTPLLAVAAALLALQLAACGTKGPQAGDGTPTAGSDSTPGQTEEGAMDPAQAKAADQVQGTAAGQADGKAADPAVENTAGTAATAASSGEEEPVDWDAHERATAKAEKEAAAQEAAAGKLPQGQEIRDQDVRYTQNLIWRQRNLRTGHDERRGGAHSRQQADCRCHCVFRETEKRAGREPGPDQRASVIPVTPRPCA